MVSFTNGTGPNGYTRLDPARYESVRGFADATNALPFLAGSSQIVSRRYYDNVVAKVYFSPLIAILVLASVLVTGVMAGLFVPRLPMDVPRRGFDLMSWISVLYGDGLVEQLPEGVRSGGLGKRVEMEDVRRRMGDVRLRFGYRDFGEYT